jgi:hypothetical protein
VAILEPPLNSGRGNMNNLRYTNDKGKEGNRLYLTQDYIHDLRTAFLK